LFDIDVRQTPSHRCHLGSFPRKWRRKGRTEEVAEGYSGLREDPDNAPSTSLSMLAMSTAGARREDEGLRIRIGRGDRSTRRRKRRGAPATRSRMMESDRASINSQLTRNEHNSDERMKKGMRRACRREGGKTLTFLSVVDDLDCR